jgi:glycerophosphoryl diester phosphodiesterase
LRIVEQLVKLPRTGLYHPHGLTFEIPMRKFRINLPTESFVRQAHSNGISVLVWTINDPEIMRKCLALNVDRIITDDPATLKRILAER